MYDATQKLDGIDKVPLTKSLLHSLKNAHTRFVEALEENKKAEKEATEKKMD